MSLSPKQLAAIASAPPSARAALRAQYLAQKRSSPQTRSLAVRVPKPPARVPRPMSSLYAFDAFDKRHLPLDEVTAPYTVTNFVSVMEIASAIDIDKVLVVCPRLAHIYGQGNHALLSDYIAMLYNGEETVDSAIPTMDNLRSPIVGAPAITDADQNFSTRVRLHNLSVRLECLGTNTGLYPPGSAYVGTVPAIETGSASGAGAEALTVKTAWAEDSISVGYLKSIPAARLVNSPACINATIAENVSYKEWRDVAIPSSAIDKGSLVMSTAMEPIIVYIPRTGAGDTVVNYRVVVGQQWCSRHPHDIMLRSTQKSHPATKPDVWHSAVSAMKEYGPKLLEIAGEGVMAAAGARMGAPRGGLNILRP